jgi:L-aspartate oxidase
LSASDSGVGDPVSGAAEPSAYSREALWRHAGLERDAESLRELFDDPHPLISLIARSALARAESRGAHQRGDFPALDPRLDGMHVTVQREREPELDSWA